MLKINRPGMLATGIVVLLLLVIMIKSRAHSGNDGGPGDDAYHAVPAIVAIMKGLPEIDAQNGDPWILQRRECTELDLIRVNNFPTVPSSGAVFVQPNNDYNQNTSGIYFGDVLSGKPVDRAFEQAMLDGGGLKRVQAQVEAGALPGTSIDILMGMPSGARNKRRSPSAACRPNASGLF